MEPDNFEGRLNVHHKTLFGDPENMKENPGIVSEQMRTNEILTELTESVKWITRLIIAGFLAAIGTLLMKGGH